jgi:hypothetical protein
MNNTNPSQSKERMTTSSAVIMANPSAKKGASPSISFEATIPDNRHARPTW